MGAPAANVSLADLVRQFRSEARLSQEELAERAGISTRTVSDIECGVAKAPRAITLSLLAEALGLDQAARERLRGATRRPTATIVAAERVDGDRANLPVQVTSFVGREHELGAIAALFDDHRVVTLAGPGGIGKTRISLAVAAALLARFPDGVRFVALAPVSDAALVPDAVASALGVRLPEGAPPGSALVAAVGTKRAMLVLDNCEHVLDAAATLVAALQRGCPNVAVLASSRQKLDIEGEAVYRIPPLTVPPEGAPLGVAEALRYEAVALFVARARAADGRFALTERDVSAVAHICRRLDGLPLAIELAAGRIDVLGPSELRDRLDQRFLVLRAAGRDVEPRRQTLRALIDWSYDLLNEPERALFRRLGVFANGCTLEAAEGVAADDDLPEDAVFDVIASLVDKSLVVAEIDESRTRFRLLETTRAYALDRLQELGERERLAGSHLAYFRARAERTHAAFLATGSDAAFMTTLAAELEDIRAALAWSLGGGDLIAGATLAVAIGHPWSRLGRSAEGIAYLEAFARALGDGDPMLLAQVWSSIAWLAFNTLRAARADEAAARAVAYARRSGDGDTLAEALGYAAIAAARRGRFDEATASLAEAEALVGATPTAAQRLRQVELRGFVAQLRGDLTAAADAYETHRALRRKLGDAFGEANATLTLAEIEHASGRTERAAALTREVLPDASRLLGPEQHANALANLAGYLLTLDDPAAAREAAAEALDLLSEGDPGSPIVVLALEHAALALALEGRTDDAARLCGYCNAAVAELGVLREYTERLTHERLASLLRESLADEERNALEREGATLGPADALEVLRSAVSA